MQIFVICFIINYSKKLEETSEKKKNRIVGVKYFFAQLWDSCLFFICFKYIRESSEEIISLRVKTEETLQCSDGGF